MKLPARIFVSYVKDEELPTIGVFRTERINDEPNQQYIRRDMAVQAILKYFGCNCDPALYEKLLDEAIQDAEKGVAK